MAKFHFFRIWTSAKLRPMTNAILQSLMLGLVNVNMYAKFCHNIPYGSRVNFSLSHNLDLGKASTNAK